MVDVGVAVTVAPVVADRPAAGNQLYVPPVPAPLAVTVAPAPPGQIVAAVGDREIVGGAEMANAVVAVSVQP